MSKKKKLKLCQRAECKSDRLLSLYSMARDRNDMMFKGEDIVDFSYCIPVNNVCGSDGAAMTVCLECGQVQGEFPVVDPSDGEDECWPQVRSSFGKYYVYFHDDWDEIGPYTRAHANKIAKKLEGMSVTGFTKKSLEKLAEEARPKRQKKAA